MGKYSSSGRKHTNCKIIRSSAAKQGDVKLINNCISSNINNHEINRRGKFGEDEEGLIIRLHSLLGNRWSLIAGRLPGRTAGEVKNHWESHIISKAKNLTIITCACCNRKPQHHPPHINISNQNIVNKSSSSSASREDHRRPIRKLSEYYHALDPTAPDDDDDDDDGGEIDLSLKIGLPFSTASSHRFIRTVADQEEKKKMMMMVEEVIARDVEAAQINDYETPALLLFR